jgi:hypothetical protein
MNERELMEQEIRDLTCDLSSSNSDIGDWKIAKCMEYITLGKEAPYDLAELSEKRQAVRDKINELQDKLENMSD